MADDTAIRAAAHHYMQRDWKIIPLYGVRADGTCMCNRPACSSAGKHPIGAAGPAGGWLPPIDDPEQLPGGANIGLKTGLASGAFALDVDPKNGGDERLAELIAEHGPLPSTWWQRTGSGGQHLLFSLPDDFTPTNSRGRLPVGLDIRGEGGQIVLAPSVSAVGRYDAGERITDVTSPAPQWLLDLIRPLPPIQIPTGEYAMVRLPGESGADRGTAYAQAAVREELGRLEGAVPGERNATAFRVACRLIELSNAPWSGLSEVDAAAEFVRFGHTLVGPDFTEHELWQCWRSAARKIGYGSAVLPAPPGGLPATAEWGALGGPPVAPPFSPNGGSSVSAALPPVPGSLSDPFENALPSTGPIYPPASNGVGSPFTAGTPAITGATPTGLEAYLLPRSQIGRLPRPVPLIAGTLWRDTDAWLIGASGSGKSFVALDWAAHVAAGKDWNGRRTTAGRVLYLVAEGAAGIQQRLDAWELAQHRAAARVLEETGEKVEPVTIPDEFVVLPVPVQAVARAGREIQLSPGWRELMALADRMRPALIVLDTQARISLGLNENDNAEMGQFIEAVGALRRASGGACVLVVHHTGRNGGDARGASAIDGAQDVEWKVERASGSMDGALVLEKNKNGADGVRHPFRLELHTLGFDQDTGERVTSLTVDFEAFAQRMADGEPEHRTMQSEIERQILEVLREGSLTSGATKAEIYRKVKELRVSRGLPRVGERTVDYAIDQPDVRRSPGLLQKDLIVQIGQRFVAQERLDQA